MLDGTKQLFVGIKISPKLQSDLDNPAPGTEHYFKEENTEYLRVVMLGADKVIGRFLQNGFPAGEIENVSRNICSIVRLITRGKRVEEESVRIYGINSMNGMSVG